MRRRYFFLLLFLIPTLIYGISDKECKNIRNQVSGECQKHNELVERVQKLNPNEIEEKIVLLRQAIGCCDRALHDCNRILENIASRSKSGRKKSFRAQMKFDCERDRDTLDREIEGLRKGICKIESESIHIKAEETAILAEIKNRDCERVLNNVDAVISSLRQASKLYAAALIIERKALLNFPSDYDDQSKDVLKQTVEKYRQFTDKYRKEAADWPASVAERKERFIKKVAALKEDGKIFTEKGLKRFCYDSQKQAVPILDQLVEASSGLQKDSFKEELAELQVSIASFEKEADAARLTISPPISSEEEFRAREKMRKEGFFSSDILLKPYLFSQETLKNGPFPRVVPLDGQLREKENSFILYAERFDRFLVQSERSISELFIKVYEDEMVIHEEKIVLPFANIEGLEAYLKGGMIFIPETELRSKFGFDLRLNFSQNERRQFSMIIAQKGMNPRYRFSIGLNQEASLYESRFSGALPWQLSSLSRLSWEAPYQPVKPSSTFFYKTIKYPSDQILKGLKENGLAYSNGDAFPVLDRLVEELKGDPLSLANYVQNEISLADPYPYRETGVFCSPPIYRSPCMTYLDRQGSAWEQCRLLVYLLRKAGYLTMYGWGEYCSLPKDFVEKMLFIKIPENEQEVRLRYPHVIFFNGKEWITLFPWMKEMQVREGKDLYGFMPEEYASADRWILRYLKGDENIFKHTGPDGDDTLGVLFPLFVKEELRKQGLCLDDIGGLRSPIKRRFSSWQDFPRPTLHGQSATSLKKVGELFATLDIDIASRENPEKKLICKLPLEHFNGSTSGIYFLSPGNNQQFLNLQIQGEPLNRSLELNPSDHTIDIKMSFKIPFGGEHLTYNHTCSVQKGTTAAFCCHSGGGNSELTSQFYERFTSENDPKRRQLALLSFVGASYFEKCSRAEKVLTELHKINPTTMLSFGLAKLSPDPTTGSFLTEEDLVVPQVDIWSIPARTFASTYALQEEFDRAYTQCQALITVDRSSNEHRILCEVFKDPYAVSTIQLLRLAYREQLKKGLKGEGFFIFTPDQFRILDKDPDSFKSRYFPDLCDVNLKNIKDRHQGQWDAVRTCFESRNLWTIGLHA